jgi:hypothetical protein
LEIIYVIGVKIRIVGSLPQTPADDAEIGFQVAETKTTCRRSGFRYLCFQVAQKEKRVAAEKDTVHESTFGLS